VSTETGSDFQRRAYFGPTETAPPANSTGCKQIPYATEQGIYSDEQGIFLREQGISARQQGSRIGDQFQAGGASWCGDETASRRMVLGEGFAWNGTTYRSLTEIAFAMDRHPLVGRSRREHGCQCASPSI
jgi:hypothetical protein